MHVFRARCPRQRRNSNDETVQSTSMSKTIPLALAASAICLGVSSHAFAFDEAAPEDNPRVIYARPEANPPMPIRVAYQERSNMGGGLIEFLFSGGQSGNPEYAQPRYEQRYEPVPSRGGLPPMDPQYRQEMRQGDVSIEPGRPGIDPKFEKQVVEYDGKYAPGTLVIDTPNKFLYLVQGGGKALRYGIGVGKPGFTWSGVKTVSAKKEWPAWTPPPEMLKRRPDLPRHMEGGPENPLGARAMYLGTSLYRIHGSNEPWTIGTNVSSGCIRMRNEDVIDLYGRVPVGTKVVVI
ncbi:MAG: L,D-transpeptidase [Afipia sp.]|nr:L,D-transpeptidase [Afipia sp.]